MTREEAIIYFKRHLDLYCVEGISKEAEEMAIKALEQEPCEDAISRQAVIDATVKKNSIWNNITNSKGENLEEIISQLPSITSQPTMWYCKEFKHDNRNIRILAWHACSEVYKVAIDAKLTDTERHLLESLIIGEMSTAIAKSLEKDESEE